MLLARNSTLSTRHFLSDNKTHRFTHRLGSSSAGRGAPGGAGRAAAAAGRGVPAAGARLPPGGTAGPPSTEAGSVSTRHPAVGRNSQVDSR